jgi:two-component system osmolarity sensor histidine kinase EnvZ
VTLLPRSLFGRLALLLLLVVAIAIAATILLFHQDRLDLLTRQLDDTKIVQLKAIRAALESLDAGNHRDAMLRIAREYGVRIIDENERPMFGANAPPPQRRAQELAERLREQLGPGTEVRPSPNRGLLFVRVQATDSGYWIGFPLLPPASADDRPSRAAIWSLVIAGALLIAAFIFARYLSRPLRDLSTTVERIGRGEAPDPLPEYGPSEIAALNRGVNRMMASLTQLERDRAVMLAGVSHDLRTPLARLRLGIEMEARDEATRAGMVDDIEEMDRIIGQFLDFARTNEDAGVADADVDDIVHAAVERHVRAGHDVRFTPGAVPSTRLRATAFSRLVANLLDNAIAYGAPPVEVSTRSADQKIVLEIADHGPGIAPDQVERLKQPFTRASVARSNADSVAGAGLGLAIVDRIARLHGGSFDLLAREGGGTLARVAIPARSG